MVQHFPLPCREDEQYRRHPRRVAEQRGDCAILDSLLHFQSLGAQAGRIDY